MGDLPPVSVLMSVRDGVATIDAALASLERQGFADFEVVVVNDGSIDGTGAVLDHWALRDARFRVVHIARSGLIEALNVGLALCRAPLIARMDADDICHPRRLEFQVAVLNQRPEVGVVSCLVRHFPRLGLQQGTVLYEDWLNRLKNHQEMRRECFVESPVAHPSVIVRRTLLDKVGGYRDMGWAEDYDLWLRLFERDVVFAKVERSLLFWRQHPNRLTRRDERYSIDNFLRAKAHFLSRGPLAARGPIVLWGSGPTGRKMSRFLRVNGVTIEAVVDIDPRRIGSTLHGAPIIAPPDLPRMLPAVVLATVGSRGARQIIRSQLLNLGLKEGYDFWCVA